MATFLIGLVVLFVGAAIYGKFCEKVFGPDDRETPAYSKQDGVDYVPMREWKNSLINLLNIAGTGPIIGPIQGILFGPIAFITIPIGSFAGGLAAGFPVGMVLRNLIPIALFAVLIALGLAFLPNGMVKGFQVFGRIIVIIITIGLAAAIIQKLTPLTLIPGMNPISEGVAIVGDIAVVLAGAFPLVYVITRVFKTPLMKLGHVLGMNDIAAAGLVATLANNIPMFQMLHDMDRRGKIINVAFAVSAAFVFGDHLGFTAGFDSTMIFPMIVGKLVGGVTAVAVAMLITRKYKEERHG